MIGKEFVGKTQVVKTTPNGGKVTVAFGNIYTTDDQKLQAIAFQILDSVGDTVTEFALQPETFGVLLDAIKELYDDTI
jgi:hypothetical protein